MVQELDTDYLVIGAGAMGMAFVDELVTRSRGVRVILVDRRATPGGFAACTFSLAMGGPFRAAPRFPGGRVHRPGAAINLRARADGPARLSLPGGGR